MFEDNSCHCQKSVIMATSEVNIEGLLFKATNPLNKLEDVNTIKQFCDAVNSNLGGDAAAVACKLLAHKIQSPQEREAVQALAVLEAGVKSCGPVFHTEVGKFKFLNEMIKLVSPKYMVSSLQHISDFYASSRICYRQVGLQNTSRKKSLNYSTYGALKN